MSNIYAIYSRKSKYTGKGESIDNQIEICKKYLKNNLEEDYEILVYEDEGFTGKNTFRPNYTKMMNDAKKLKFKAIVCYRLDRISRKIGDFANLIDELKKYNTSFISVKERFDTNTPTGRAMMYIVSVFSQLERETIAERIKDNMYELSKTGRWLGGTCPTGYKSVSIESVDENGKLKKEYKLEFIPEEINIVKLIFDKFLETKSLSKVETFLMINNYKSKNQKNYTRFAIRNILSNPVYMIADKDAFKYIKEKDMDLFSKEAKFNGKSGIMAYNKTLQSDKKAWRYKDNKEWIVSVGKHKGTINGKTWIQVQDILEANKSKGYRNPRSNMALLSGLLFCKNCGDYMRPKSYKKRGPNNEKLYYYLCKKKEITKGALCNINNPQGNELDKHVIDEIKQMAYKDSDFVKMSNKVYRKISDRKFDWDIRENTLSQELKNKKNQIDTLISALSKSEGEAAYEYIFKQINKLDIDIKNLEQELGKVQISQINNDLYNEELTKMTNALSLLNETIDDSSFEEIKDIVKDIVKKVEWDGEKVHIYMFGYDETEVIWPEEDDDIISDVMTPDGEYSK